MLRMCCRYNHGLLAHNRRKRLHTIGLSVDQVPAHSTFPQRRTQI
jgi:hypothetical protein